MIDYENLRTTVASGLSKYLGCPVIRNNQNAELPEYPFASYTITTPMTANNGTYGEYEDRKARKPVTCVWSISIQSDNDAQCVTLAYKAREWFDYVGTVYLNDNDVIVQSVGAVGNRDNVLTVDYEYKKGFDVVFWLYDVVDMPDDGEIEAISFDGKNTIKPVTIDELNKRLEERLDGE